MTNSTSALQAIDKESLVKPLMQHCMQFKGGETGRSIFQITTTISLFAVACGLMIALVLSNSYWALPVLWLFAGGLLVRIFIFQHDCGHMSFFKTRKANDRVGRALSVLTVTPYAFWRDAHNMHHAASGNLEGRGIGSIDTVTVSEYQKMSNKDKFFYRLYRNPLVTLVIGPPLHVMFIQRIPTTVVTNFFADYKSISFKKAWPSIMGLNLALVLFYGSLSLLFGAKAVALTFVMPIAIAAWAGGWLFYIQHQFEDAYWEKKPEWNFQEAAVLGSSYYKLPKIMQWFTGNIGLHHIHHLCSLIPNYKLQECMDAHEPLKTINVMTFRDSLKSIHLALWDEARQKMISFKDYKILYPAT